LTPDRSDGGRRGANLRKIKNKKAGAAQRSTGGAGKFVARGDAEGGGEIFSRRRFRPREPGVQVIKAANRAWDFRAP